MSRIPRQNIKGMPNISKMRGNKGTYSKEYKDPQKKDSEGETQKTGIKVTKNKYPKQIISGD